MRTSSTGERIPALALVHTDNCSVADTSIDDRTLPSDKKTEKRPSRENSPATKHKGLPIDGATIENWRPHVSTVTEKSSSSADSMAEQPPKATEMKGKSNAIPNASDLGSLRRRRPGATYGVDALPNLKARVVAEHDVSNVSSAAPSTRPETRQPEPMRTFPLEFGQGVTTDRESSLRNVSSLPKFFAPDYGITDDDKSATQLSDDPSEEDQHLDFSFTSFSRLPLFNIMHGPPHADAPLGLPHARNPLDEHPDIQSLPPVLQGLVRKNLTPEASEKGRTVAAMILELFAGHKQIGPFEFPSQSRLPLYVNLRPKVTSSPRQDADGDTDDLEYAKGTDGSFSLSHCARLPLHMIAGAESRQMEIHTNMNKVQLTNFAHPKTWTDSNSFDFEFLQEHRLPSYSSLFKGPIETSTLNTQLVRKGVPLQIVEVSKKGHVIGSVDSVGRYVRPNADPRFLFSITPFTKSEVLRGKTSKDVLFGKLEKTWRKQEHAGVAQVAVTKRSSRSTSTNGTTGTCARAGHPHCERTSASTRSTQRDSSSTTTGTQTAPSSISINESGPNAPYRAPPPSRAEPSVDGNKRLAGDRHRFDALVNRLQQKLSEQSQQSGDDVKDANSNVVHINYQVSGEASSTTGKQNESQIGQPNRKDKPPPLPPRPNLASNPPHSSAPVPSSRCDGALDPRKAPFQPSYVPYAFSNNPNKHTMVPGMEPGMVPGIVPGTVPMPLAWQLHPPQGPLPAPASLVPPVPVSMPAIPPLPQDHNSRPPYSAPISVPGWPMSKRPSSSRRRTPFVPLAAADQQKIEEHIELLKATIPNYATLSKRRQELRWGRQNRQKQPAAHIQVHPQVQPQAQQLPSVQSAQPAQPAQQLRHMQLHQVQMQQMQQMHEMHQQHMQKIHQTQQDQQQYQQGQPGSAMQGIQSMQPLHLYGQYYPNTLAAPTWAMPLMNTKM
ncbi:hypothetical protein HMPREF1624_02914 [Sporothrix schenckii ATCC 58251]|uniref:Uncharacterized protein n=1 Tax=Sporothrix schenckii (strain ATCC 58251 / de Perez 2211183) TaxID=1391915 RepID=U7Q3A6_SPOS1|nr:hypothetical protein HMPREF1624_02914 [Sporothrix schenckii ATCC 58251]